MKSNQFTIDEARAIALNPESINDSDLILMQGDNWGTFDMLGTYAEWADEIPADEEKARATGFYDWYVSDERYYHDNFSWTEYRSELMNQLRAIEIIED